MVQVSAMNQIFAYKRRKSHENISIPPPAVAPLAWLRGAVALAAGAGVLLLAAISCSTINRQAVVLPDVPGAKYVGSAECEQCHDEICRSFKTADHARLIAQGKNGLDAGCESCHGPCSLHEDSGGDVKPPYSFTAGRPQPDSIERRGSRWNRRAPSRPPVTNATWTCAASSICPAIIPCPKAG